MKETFLRICWLGVLALTVTGFSSAQVLGSLTRTITAAAQHLQCPTNAPPDETIYSNWVYKDFYGVNHTFVGTTYEDHTVDYFSDNGHTIIEAQCGTDSASSMDILSTDGKYHLQAVGGAGTVTLAGVTGLVDRKYVLDGLTYAPPGQGTDHFTVNVPKKTTSPFLPITTFKAIVALSNPISVSGSVTFTLTDENGTSNALVCSATSCTPTASSTICPEGLPWVCFALPASETGAYGADHLKLYQTSGTADDPVRYEIDMLLLSNVKFGTQNNCINTQSADLNSYTVKISSPGGNKIMGVCLQSFDGLTRPQGWNSCTPAGWNTQAIPIPLDDPNDKVATFDSQLQPEFASFQPTPPLEVNCSAQVREH